MSTKPIIDKPDNEVYELEKKRTLRKRAEDELRKKFPGKEHLSQEETQSVIHELEIHQTELEMQNEELRQTQQKLLESHDRFTDLYDFAPTGYVTISHNGLILEANLTIATMLGIERSLLIKKRFTDYIVPQDQDIYYKYIQNILKTKGHQSLEVLLRENRVGYFWAKLDGVTAEVADETNSRVRFAISDISGLKRVVQKFRESEKKLQALYTAMNEGLCQHEIIYDNKGKAVDYRILDINPAYETITGLDKDNAIGRLASDLYGTGEPPFLDLFATVASTGEPLVFETPFPPLQKHFHVSVFSPGKGKFATVFSDITKRIQADEELSKYRESLEKMVKDRTTELQLTHDQLLHAEKLCAIGNLTASIAHEFNNPLFGIRNVLGGVKKRAHLEEDDINLVDMALKECDRMKTLIQDLQDFNRPTSSVMAPLDVHKTIDNMLLLLTNELKSKKIKVEKNYAANMPNIRAIGDQIKQVLLNLFNNASDAIPRGGGTITIYTYLHDKMIEILVRDTGVGIKPEVMEHIFEPFYTTKDAAMGTGLGLSVSFGIVKRHGGRIDVDSEVGKGSNFSIILPIEGTSA